MSKYITHVIHLWKTTTSSVRAQCSILQTKVISMAKNKTPLNTLDSLNFSAMSLLISSKDKHLRSRKILKDD